jgi:hypothetical protein
MKTYVYFWQYLDEFSLEWEMFPREFVENIKTQLHFQKFFRLWDKVETYGTARQATDDNITWRMRFACWINKTSIQTHTQNM